MKTSGNLSIGLFLLVLAVTACSLGGGGKESGGKSSSNSSGSDAVVEESTGIPECDRLFAKIEEKATDANNESSMLERAAYNFLKDQILKPIREELANKTDKDKKEVAAKCTEAYDKLIEEEEKDAEKR